MRLNRNGSLDSLTTISLIKSCERLTNTAALYLIIKNLVSNDIDSTYYLLAFVKYTCYKIHLSLFIIFVTFILTY